MILRRKSLFLALLVIATSSGRSRAEDNIWNNGANNWIWSNSANNWQLIPYSWNNANVDTAIFRSIGAETITLGNPITLRAIQFDYGSSNYVITGNTLTFANGGSSVFGLVVGEIQVTRAGSSAQINSQIAGNVGLTKTGLGTLTLSNGNNIFTSNVTVREGTLKITASGNGTNSALGVLNAIGTIHTYGTLNFGINNVFGGFGMSAANLPLLAIYYGGTVSATRFNAIGNVTMDGGLLTQASTDSSGYAGYQFLGTVDASGTVISTISTTNGRGNHLLGTTAASGTTFNVTTTGSGSLLVTAPLIDPSPAYSSTGLGRLIKTGTGLMILAGNNTYTGVTSVNGGTLQAGNGGTSGNFGTAPIDILLGSSLAYLRSDTSLTLTDVYRNAGKVIFTGTNVINQSSYTLSVPTSGFTGSMQVGATDGGKSARLVVTHPNQIAGATSITVKNDSSLFLSGGGTYTNTWNLTGDGWLETAWKLGALRLGTGTTTVMGTINLPFVSARLHVDAGGTATIGANIVGVGNTSIMKSGPGVLILSGTNSYDFGTFVTEGTLRIGAANSLLPAGALLDVANGATFDLNNFNQTITSLANDGTVLLGSATLTSNSSNDTDFGGQITGTGSLIKQGTAKLTLSGATNNYTGGTTVTGGTLEFTASQINATGAVNVNNSGTTILFSATDVYGQHTVTTTPTVTVNSGTVTNSVGFFNTFQNLTLNGGTLAGVGGKDANFRSWSVRDTLTSTGTSAINLTGTNSGFNLGQDGDTIFNVTSGTLTLSGSLVNNRNAANTTDILGTLIKSGAGTLVLSSSNSFTGGVTLNAGVLQLGNTGALNSTTPNSVTFGPSSTAILRLNGNNVTIAGLNSDATPGTPVVENASASIPTLTVNNATNNTFAGVIRNGTGTGGLSLTKTGVGILTLSGISNLYGSNVNGGTLKIPGGGSVANNFSIIGDNSGSNGTVEVGGGTGTSTWTNSSNLFVGHGGTGTLKITGGGSVSNVTGSIGFNSTGNGTVEVGGGTGASTWANSSNLFVGNSGTGMLTITGGGSVSNVTGSIGFNSTGNGTVEVGGGTGTSTWANSIHLFVGNDGTGMLKITGGGSVSNATGIIGYNSGSNGTVEVGGGTGTSTWANSSSLFVGDSGTGTLKITGGGSVSNTSGSIGYNSGSNGTVEVGGGTGTSTWANSSNLFVGNSGTGMLTIKAGGLVSATALDGGNASSSIQFDGGTLRITATDSASNIINLLAGGGTIDTPNAANTFTIASAISGVGSLTKSGPGILVLTNAGNNLTGGLTVARGILSVATDTVLGATLQPVAVNPLGTLSFSGTTSTGRVYNLSTGSLKAASGTTLTFNNAAVGGGFLSGTFTTQAGSSNIFSGGTTITSSTLTLNGTDSLSNFTNGGQLTVSPGTTGATANAFTNTSNGRITIGNGTVGSGATLTVSDFVSNGLITLTAGGTGTTERNRFTNTASSDIYFGGGSRTLIGTIGGNSSSAFLNLGTKNGFVAGGILVNNGTVSNGQMIVDYGGLVKGGGTFTSLPLTQNGGIYSPGNSPGQATVGDATLTPAGTFRFQINNATGTAGPVSTTTVSGWSLLNVQAFNDPDIGITTGNLTITATSANKFNIRLQTLMNPTPVGTDNYGLMSNFNSRQSNNWMFLKYEGAYSGPTTPAALNDVFNVDATDFQNLTDGGTFSIGHDTAGKSLSLVYTPAPVPEPGSLLAIAAAGMGLAGWVRRRWSRKTCNLTS